MALPGPEAPEPRGVAGSAAIRVLHVVNSLDAGGMERVLIRVASELQPRGFDISVCGLQRRGVLSAEIDPEEELEQAEADGPAPGTMVDDEPVVPAKKTTRISRDANGDLIAQEE